MHSNRMRTVHCSGRLSCHAHPPPTMHTSLPYMPPCHMCPPCHAHPLPYTPPAMHVSHHACLPCHASPFPCHACPSATHVPPPPHMHPCYKYPHHACPPTTHANLPCMPPPPPPGTEFLTCACDNITFPRLLLRTVKMRYSKNWTSPEHNH